MTTAALDIHRAKQHPTIVEAWSAVMEDVRSVGKDGYNDQQRYKFRGIDAVVNAVGPALRRNGVIITPRLVELEYSDVTVGQRQTRMGHARVIVEYTARNGTEQLIIGEVPGEAMDVGDKAVAKAMSVAYRIALLQSLTLPTDDPDPDAQTVERAPRRKAATPELVPEAAETAPAAPTTVTMRRRTNNDDRITQAQLGALHTGFTRHHITDRAAGLMYCENVINRPIESTKELTKQEASRVIDALKTGGPNE